jgi:hypothetical protein
MIRDDNESEKNYDLLVNISFDYVSWFTTGARDYFSFSFFLDKFIRTR